MGLISFIKEAGAYLFGAGAGNAIAATQAKPVTTEILKQQVDILGIPVKDLRSPSPIRSRRSAAWSARTATRRRSSSRSATRRASARSTISSRSRVAARRAATPAANMYTVKKGDTLSAIAKAEYGDANKYPVIFEANKPMLKDPNKIYPGQVLRIPPKP